MSSKKILEKDIIKAILDYLHYRRIMAWRNNTGAFMGGNNGRRGFYKFGAIGSGDIFAIYKGQFYSLEVKRPGGKQSEAQIAWQKQFEANGGRYAVIRDLEEVIKLLN